MNAKLIKILEKAEEFLPEDNILDSYFNASEERRNRIMDTINERVIIVNCDLDDKLDWIYNHFDDSMAIKIKQMMEISK